MLARVVDAFLAMLPLVAIVSAILVVALNAQKKRDETLKENNDANIQIQIFLAKDKKFRNSHTK